MARPKFFRRAAEAADRVAEAGGEAAELARMLRALVEDLDEIVEAWHDPLMRIGNGLGWLAGIGHKGPAAEPDPQSQPSEEGESHGSES